MTPIGDPARIPGELPPGGPTLPAYIVLIRFVEAFTVATQEPAPPRSFYLPKLGIQFQMSDLAFIPLEELARLPQSHLQNSHHVLLIPICIVHAHDPHVKTPHMLLHGFLRPRGRKSVAIGHPPFRIGILEPIPGRAIGLFVLTQDNVIHPLVVGDK